MTSKVNRLRRKHLASLVEGVTSIGVDPVEAMGVIARRVFTYDFYREKGYGIDNALSDDKWLKHYEAGAAVEAKSKPAVVPVGMEPGSRVRWLKNPLAPYHGHREGVFVRARDDGRAEVDVGDGFVASPKIELLELVGDEEPDATGW